MTSANSGSVTDAAGCAALNGSNETVTIWRLATAKAMSTMPSGTRISAATILRSELPADRDAPVNLRSGD